MEYVVIGFLSIGCITLGFTTFNTLESNIDFTNIFFTIQQSLSLLLALRIYIYGLNYFIFQL